MIYPSPAHLRVVDALASEFGLDLEAGSFTWKSRALLSNAWDSAFPEDDPPDDLRVFSARLRRAWRAFEQAGRPRP